MSLPRRGLSGKADDIAQAHVRQNFKNPVSVILPVISLNGLARFFMPASTFLFYNSAQSMGLYVE
jgi:hypothetical protein